MREAGVTAIVLRHGLPVRRLWAAWVGLCVAFGTAGLALHAALAADARYPLAWAFGLGAAAGALALVVAWRSMADAAWLLTSHPPDWFVAPADHPSPLRQGTVDPMMDLGGWVLMRFREAQGRHDIWLSASASQLGAGWHPLRAALFRPDGAAGASRRA
jgi:hypothetical protein